MTFHSPSSSPGIALSAKPNVILSLSPFPSSATCGVSGRIGRLREFFFFFFFFSPQKMWKNPRSAFASHRGSSVSLYYPLIPYPDELRPCLKVIVQPKKESHGFHCDCAQLAPSARKKHHCTGGLCAMYTEAIRNYRNYTKNLLRIVKRISLLF